MMTFHSETAQGGNFGKGSDPVSWKNLWREMPKQRLQTTSHSDLVEILEATKGTEEKRE